REATDAGEVHALVGVSPGRSALAAPGNGDAPLVANLEGQGHPDADGKHRGEVAHHRVEPEPRVAHVDVAVAAARGAVLTAHVLSEDAPRLDAAGDVDAHVALQRRPHVVRAHRRPDAHRGGFVPAPGVEGPGNLPLL